MGKAHMRPYACAGPLFHGGQLPSVICNQPDSGSHILGGCLHPDMKKMTIFRHDEAHRLMLKGISKGKLGSSLTIADVGSAEKLSTIGLHHKRSPKWALPDSVIATKYSDVQISRNSIRPDIMIVELETEQGPWGELDHLQENPASNSRPLPAIMQVQHSGVPGQLDPYTTERLRRVWIIEGSRRA